MNNEKGFALIETIVALAILGTVAVAFLSGLATSVKATVISEERAIAESLVRSEMEYIKKCAYEYDTSQGPVTAFYQTISNNSNNGYFEKFMGDQGTLIISEDANRDVIYPESRNIDAMIWARCIKEGSLIAPKEIMQIIDNLTLDQLAKIFLVEETPPPLTRPSLKLPIKMDKLIHQPHLENFFDAIRGKTKLNCPAEIGYETAAAVLKVNEAAEAGRKLEFRPADFTV